MHVLRTCKDGTLLNCNVLSARVKCNGITCTCGGGGMPQNKLQIVLSRSSNLEDGCGLTPDHTSMGWLAVTTADLVGSGSD